MASTASIPVQISGRVRLWGVLAFIRPLQLLVGAPVPLFLIALTAMLFRPPDLHFYGIDRIAVTMLVFSVFLRTLITRQSLRFDRTVTLPLSLLIVIALTDLLYAPSQVQDWSVFAAKWAVPFLLYQLAQHVFVDRNSIAKLEIYLLVVLAYLSLIAVFFLIDARSLIVPAYILDGSIGIHADRARGPFLQAVANGVTLLLLGLIAADSYRRRRLPGLVALIFAVLVPLAVLATKTRSVWISFAGAVLFLTFFASSMRIRRACGGLAFAGALAVLGILLFIGQDSTLGERVRERSPVEFRLSLYRAGWDMFKEKPLFGWVGSDIQNELSKTVNDFHQDEFFFHNSYLEVAVKYGSVGPALYLWVLWDLVKAGGKPLRSASREVHFLDERFRFLWPVFVGVYLFNACFVVMNYQFVNGLLFTLAGILVTQNRQWNASSAIV